MLVKLLFAVCIIGLSTTNFFGCMCGHSSVCDAYTDAAAVVVAKVIKFKPAQILSKQTYEDGSNKLFNESGQEVTLDVSRWYKGAGGRRLKLLQPNSTCDWSFDDGDLNKKYLFYLYLDRDNGNYAIISCGRSSDLGNAGDDLSWLSGLPKSLKRTRISGVARLNGETDSFPLLPGIPIHIDGQIKSYTVKSNEKGFYEQWDVPAGKYRVTATIPSGLILNWSTSVPEDWTYFWSLDQPEPKALDVTIEPGKCGGVDFMFKKK